MNFNVDALSELVFKTLYLRIVNEVCNSQEFC